MTKQDIFLAVALRGPDLAAAATSENLLIHAEAEDLTTRGGVVKKEILQGGTRCCACMSMRVPLWVGVSAKITLEGGLCA